MSAFNTFERSVLTDAGALARTTLGGFVAEAETDTRAFLQQSSAKLTRWTGMLGSGQLTKQEFAALVDSQKMLAVLHELTHAGVGLASVQRFRDGLVDIVVKAALAAFI